MAAKAVKKKPDTLEKNGTKTVKKTESQKTVEKTTGRRTATSAKKSSSSSTGNAAVVSKKQESTQFVKPSKKPRIPSPFAKEATLLVLWALCAFLFFSYFGFGGYIGDFLSALSFGLFGSPAYLLPALFAVAAGFLISNHRNHLAVMKTLAAAVLYITICSFIGLGDSVFYSEAKILDIYQYCANGKTGGGAVSGEICHLLTPALGTIGTGIFLTIAVVLCLLLITQRSLLKWLRCHLREFYTTSKERSTQRKEEQTTDRSAFSNFPDPTGLQVERKPVRSGALHTRSKKQPFTSCENAGRRHPAYEKKGESEKAVTAQNSVRIEQRDVVPSLIVETASRPSVSGPAKTAENSINVAQNTHSENYSPVRTDIDIPIHFPSVPRQRRQDHKITGVTLDTKITGDPSLTGSDVSEILSPRASLSARTAATEDQRPKPALRYIDLDTEDDDFSDLPDDFLAQLQESSTHANPADAQMEEPSPVQELSGEAFRELDFDPPAEQTEASDLEHHISKEPPCSELKPEEKSAASFSPDDFFLSDEEAKLRAATSSGHVFTQNTKKQEAAPLSRTGSDTAASAQDMHDHSPKRNPRSSSEEIQEGINDVRQEAAKAAETIRKEHIFPPIDLLKPGQLRSGNSQDLEVKRTAAKLQQTLNSFGVRASVINASCGPSVTRYELMPEQGVKVSKIVALTDDIRLNLAAADIRIEAPIPGKSAVGIEVPNKENSTVALRDLIESDAFKTHKSNLAFAVGKDIGGNTVVADIAKMPHLLIAGATGSGKSVCINTLIMSILYKAKPDDVKLIMIDPKVVELSVYNGIPHLFIPVVTDPKKAAGALNWGVAEMTDRYNKFAEYGVRDLKGYNQKVAALEDIDDPNKPKKLPQIVIIVDELADLMMVAPGEVEDSICRLAQLARAAGIHLIIATQRPSVNVITGLIKANMPSRIAFSVSSGVDSRTIIDMNGAEKLLGKGDMLFYPQGYQKPARVQGAFVSDEEVSDVVDFLKNQNTDSSYSADMQAQLEKVQQVSSASRSGEDVDELFADAGKFIIEKDKASIGMLQRVFKIGFNRAARIMDQLSDAGVVGPEEGTKPRKILMSESEFENYLEQN